MSQVPRSLPTTSALRAFEAAASQLSFTRAAAELEQTQGAISHQIRELEARLQTRLFLRETRGIQLTEAGRTYLPYVRGALDRLRDGQRALRPDDAADHVLTVSCSPNFAHKWLVPRLGSFLEANGDVDLRISASMQHVNFDGDGIDVAVRHGDGRWPNLDVTQLCEEMVYPVCSPHLGPEIAATTRLDDLRHYPLLHDQQREGWATWLREVGADIAAFDLEQGPVFSQTSLAIDAAVAAQGVALARSALASFDLAAGRLVRPLDTETPAAFAYWIVCPRERASAHKVARFRDWIVEAARLATR